jgi:large subunit ribosomal protein L24
LRGKLALTLATPHRVEGAIDADRLDGAALIAAATGMPAGKGAGWSDEPFAAGFFGDYAGQIALKAHTADLSPQLAAREFGASLKFGKQEFSLGNITGDVAGGRLTGNLSFHAAEDGLHARVKFEVAGADAHALMSPGPRPPIAGKLALSAEAEGSGFSPVALIGSLQGSGYFTLSDGQFAGLDPRAFDAVTGAVDRGLVIDRLRISDLASNALQSGNLAVKRAQGDLAIGAGQVRLSKFTADGNGAQLSVAGSLDLITGAVDGRLVLSGASEQGGLRPDIYLALKGPLTAPQRTMDVSALTGWLTLRAIENETKKIRAIEQAPPPRTSAPRPKSEAPSARKNEAAAAPLSLEPKRAPALPPPVEVAPLPGPGRAPAASAVGTQR